MYILSLQMQDLTNLVKGLAEDQQVHHPSQHNPKDEGLILPDTNTNDGDQEVNDQPEYRLHSGKRLADRIQSITTKKCEKMEPS